MTKRIGTVGGQNQYGHKKTISKDGLVLAAIALVSVAFGVGLYEQVGVNIMLSATMAAAAFFVLFSLHYIIVQLSSSESMSPRISSLERVVARLARDMSQVDGMSKEIKEFRDTCERIDRAQSQLELGGFGEAAHLRDETTRKLTRDVKKIESQITALKEYFERSNQENKMHLKAELLKVEEHIRSTTEKFSMAQPDQTGNSLGIPTDLIFNDDFIKRPVQKANLPKSLMPQYAQDNEKQTEIPQGNIPPSNLKDPYKEQGGSNRFDFSVDLNETFNNIPGVSSSIEQVNEAIRQKRIEVFMQPIVTLPNKDVSYYEVLSRLRNEKDELLTPDTFIGPAENSGMMPIIDNMMLMRSIQIIKKLLSKGSARGLFCNISMKSLHDEEFYKEFIQFMEKNREISHRLFFDVSQEVLRSKSARVTDCLSSLSRLGYKFALDKVTRLDLDFSKLQRQGFRFIKVDTNILLNGLADAGSRIHIADLKSYLGRYGIDLIAEKVENEVSVTQLVSYDISLAQGYHFSEPRPVRSDVLKDSSGQKAA